MQLYYTFMQPSVTIIMSSSVFRHATNFNHSTKFNHGIGSFLRNRDKQCNGSCTNQILFIRSSVQLLVNCS